MINGNVKSVPLKIIDVSDDMSEVTCIFKHRIVLYDKKAYKQALKEDEPTLQWLNSLKGGRMSDLPCVIYCRFKNSNGEKIEVPVRKSAVAVPVILDVKYDAGGNLSVSGQYFGMKPPKGYLEFRRDGRKYRFRLKVLKDFKFQDYKGRSGKSVMNLFSDTGDSFISYQIKKNLLESLPDSFSLVIDNKNGIDAFEVKK
jgi:hypothetical protein